MKILVFDATSETISVALQSEDKIFKFYQHAPRQQAELILPTIKNLLLQAKLEFKNLNCLGATIGPGSFTGVRLGISIAKTLAFAHDLPIVGVSTLQVLAQSVAAVAIRKNKLILSALDARMQQVYFGVYKIVDGVAVVAQKEEVIDPDKIKIKNFANESFVTVGNGWQIYQNELEKVFGNFNLENSNILFPDAAYILPLAHAAYEKNNLYTADSLLPVYLRDDVV